VGTLAALKAHRRELIDPRIAEHNGRIVKTTGDGLLLEFPSVVDAVRCAVDVQRGMAARNQGLGADRRLDFRIGINVGDIIIDGDDIFGDGVNVAARLEALAEPGGICVSRVVRDQVLDKLSFTFEDLGAQQVKNIARPVDVYPRGSRQRRVGNATVESPTLPAARDNAAMALARPACAGARSGGDRPVELAASSPSPSDCRPPAGRICGPAVHNVERKCCGGPAGGRHHQRSHVDAAEVDALGADGFAQSCHDLQGQGH
jgi:hypothetical protein